MKQSLKLLKPHINSKSTTQHKAYEYNINHACQPVSIRVPLCARIKRSVRFEQKITLHN